MARGSSLLVMIVAKSRWRARSGQPKKPRAKILPTLCESVPASPSPRKRPSTSQDMHAATTDLKEPSASKRRRKPVYRSAPSFSSSVPCAIVGTRAEVLSCLTIQRCWRAHSCRLCTLRSYAASLLQRVWRAMVARRNGVTRLLLHKVRGEDKLGISFSPAHKCHALLAVVESDGPAHAAGLREGDRVVRLNGASVQAEAPSVVAHRLREAVGRIELHVVPARRVDIDAITSAEWAAECAHAAASIARSAVGDAGDDECAVCMSLLCEPVRWATGAGGCGHLFCRPCMRSLACRAAHDGVTPVCPLCRAGPVAKRTVSPPTEGWMVSLKVDEAAAALLQERHPQEYAQGLALNRQRSMEIKEERKEEERRAQQERWMLEHVHLAAAAR